MAPRPRKLWVPALGLGLSACFADPRPARVEDAADPTCLTPLDLSFAPDTGAADEAYLCFGFEASAFSANTVGGVRWDIATDGGFLVHHAILYAVAADFPDGPSLCDAMPDAARELHVWSPGGDDLALPADTGLELPSGTARFAVQAHTLRVGTDPAAKSRVRICGGPASPTNLAALMGMGAPVPAIRPMHEEVSSTSCALGSDLHLYSVWPHMHLVGKEITLALARSDGETASLLDVVPWDFQRQRTYLLGTDAAPGDAIQLGCVWDNPTTEYVLPGPRTTDEMCNAAFIAWPAESAHCE
jgi:hypothetical protein